jgi:hypothetical protein
LTDIKPAFRAARIGSVAMKESGAEPALRAPLTVERVRMKTISMAGSHGSRLRRRGLVVTALFAASAVGGLARAQDPAQTPPSTTRPADVATIGGFSEAVSQPIPNQPSGVAPSYYAGEGTEPTAPRIEQSLVDTIAESLFGDVYAEGRWRPLSISTFLSEGWNEGWAGAPAGRDGLTPRHGWLGAFDGVFYRLWLTTFSYTNNLNTPYHGNRYGGLYQIFLPFSRRFEILLNVPFVVANGTTTANRGYTPQFGDLTITPRFLLSETAATTQTFAMDIRTPTGTSATGNGTMALQPRYEFWTNPGGPWVVRGGSGVYVPMNVSKGPAGTAYTGDLAIGRYFTPHDVPFGDLVFYAASNWSVPWMGPAERGPTSASARALACSPKPGPVWVVFA